MGILRRFFCEHEYEEPESWSIERRSVQNTPIGIHERVVILGKERKCQKCGNTRVVEGSRRQYRVRGDSLRGKVWAEREEPGD